jgi:hypothetical protein
VRRSRARGRTIGEVAWPQTDDFCNIARRWQADASALLVGFVWKAYDVQRQAVLTAVNVQRADDDVERSITMYLAPAIRAAMDGHEPFYLEHSPFEEETRQPAPAQPPAYDLAFVQLANPRVMWPLEAKVLRTDRSVAAYVDDVREQFLSCRYAPFSSEAAMLGYLLAGTPSNAFAAIARSLECTLVPYAAAGGRDHRASTHTRAVPAGKPYPASFACHHLIMLFC